MVSARPRYDFPQLIELRPPPSSSSLIFHRSSLAIVPAAAVGLRCGNGLAFPDRQYACWEMSLPRNRSARMRDYSRAFGDQCVAWSMYCVAGRQAPLHRKLRGTRRSLEGAQLWPSSFNPRVRGHWERVLLADVIPPAVENVVAFDPLPGSSRERISRPCYR
jgi:hypothetical protein